MYDCIMRGNATLESRFARIGEKRVFYQVAGYGPAVVLLHGLSGSGRWWDRNILPLAERFRVYSVDLIGFGGSSGQRFVLEETAEIIAHWMEQVGEERYNLVGHSMGGLVSAELASRYPKRLDRLVLVDAAALPMGHTIVRSAFNLAGALRWMPWDFAPVLFKDALRAGPLTLLRASQAIHQADITEDLKKIAARTLIIWGEHDALLPARRGAELHQALPGSEFVIIQGAGHNPMWDRAGEFNRVVMAFLEGE